MNKDTTSAFDRQVEDFESSETRRNEQLRKFMSSHKETIICGGYGERLVVKQQCLYVMRGEQEPIILEPRIHRVKTIVYILAIGDISMSALKWIEKEKISLMVFDKNGEALVFNASGVKSDIDLLMRQATMPQDEKIAYYRFIVKAKVLAQAETIRKHSKSLDPKKVAYNSEEMIGMSTWCDAVNRHEMQSHDGVEKVERYCAGRYFECWQALSIKWKETTKDIRPSYKSFTHRHNGLGKSNQNASHPVNAMLNLAYSVLALRVKMACIASGLDVRISFNHALDNKRDNLVYDLIEPLRPLVDDLMLSYLAKNSLSLGDFAIDPDNGMVRLRPHFAKAIAAYIHNGLNETAIFGVVREYCDFLRAEKLVAA